MLPISLLPTGHFEQHHYQTDDYEKMMGLAKDNMKLSLNRLLEEEDCCLYNNSLHLKIKHLIDPICIEDCSELHLDKIWMKIKYCFDQALQADVNSESNLVFKHQFKEILRLFLDIGIPFVNGKSIVLWSTRFARNQAERFAVEQQRVLDGMAQDVLRKIFIGWPDGKLNVFFHALKPIEPEYPSLSKLFWESISEAFLEEVSEKDEIHVFFQDAITTGNFFWNNELPIARKKQARILLHQYETKLQKWKLPVSIDSVEADLIPIRRRHVHFLDEDVDSDAIEMKNGRVVWKQEFKDNTFDGESISWHSPEILTLGKLRSLMKNLIAVTRKSKTQGCNS